MPTYKEIITDAKDRMSKTREAFKREMQSMRAGRANPQILDRITVDYYGVQTPLNQMGNISAPEPRMLVISLWDAKAIPAVEKAIQKSDLGLNPSNDGKVIRLIFPELTEERRKELAKDVKKKGDAAKTAVRNIRRDGNDAFKKSNKAKEISEDEYAELQEKLQKITDKYVAMVDKAVEAKTKEIMTV